MSDEWIEVENTESENSEDTEMWKEFVKGESRIGILDEVNTEVGTFPGSILYIFEGDPSNPPEHQETWKIWGKTNLNEKMKEIKVGDKVKVVYVDEHPPKRRGRKPWLEFRVYKAGGEASASSSSSNSEILNQPKPHPTLQEDEPETLDLSSRQSDEEAVDDIPNREIETEDMLANGWLNKITNDMIGNQQTVSEKTLKAEIYNLSQIPEKDKDLGTLDMDMAARIFKAIDKKGY